MINKYLNIRTPVSIINYSEKKIDSISNCYLLERRPVNENCQLILIGHMWKVGVCVCVFVCLCVAAGSFIQPLPHFLSLYGQKTPPYISLEHERQISVITYFDPFHESSKSRLSEGFIACCCAVDPADRRVMSMVQKDSSLVKNEQIGLTQKYVPKISGLQSTKL